MANNGDVFNVELDEDPMDEPIYSRGSVSLPIKKLSATKSSQTIAQIDFSSDALIFPVADTVEPVRFTQCHIDGQLEQNRQSSFNNGHLTVRKLFTSRSTILVALLHIVVLIILLKLANNTVKHFVEVNNEQSLSNLNEQIGESKKIKAYFLTAKQIRQLSNEQLTKEQQLEGPASNDEKPVSTKLQPLKEFIKSEEQKNKVTETIPQKEHLLTEPIAQIEVQKAATKPILLPKMDKTEIVDKALTFEETLTSTEFDWSSVDSIYLQQDKEAINEHMFNSKLYSDDGEIENKINYLSALNSVSHSFVNQYNQQQVSELISQQSHKATSSSGASVSELTPEMDDIELILIEDKRQPTTLNHRLDPNRIVKLGETCYRVVPLPTQINPHAEGLGYAEPCDSGKMKRMLNKAIQHRLSKVQLP